MRALYHEVVTESYLITPWRPGFHAATDSEEIIFALPGMEENELRHTVDTCRATAEIVNSEFTKKAIRVVTQQAAKQIIGKAAPGVADLCVIAYQVMAADLFDTATAQMLESLAGDHTKEAARFLREAILEPTSEGKNHLRNRAAGKLSGAYLIYKREIEMKTAQLVTEPTWRRFTRYSLQEKAYSIPKMAVQEEIIELHAKAASRELAIASINRHMGLAPPVIEERATNALYHFLQHYSFRMNLAAKTIAVAAGLLVTQELNGLTASDVWNLFAYDLEYSEGFDQATEKLKKIASQHIETTRNWDGRGRDARHKTAFSLGGATREYRIWIHRENLTQVQASIDDLTHLQQCQRDFDALFAKLLEPRTPQHHRQKRWQRKR